jgi:alkanesulfonate monooxygenase SsuD/methylene tetrahydromethanopterin reductase-like flavin-dependent oxidoreductase (luciferase family)
MGRGHAPGGWRIAAHYHCVLAETRREAREIARTAWRRYNEATTHTLDRLRADQAYRGAPGAQKMVEDLLDIDRMVDEMRIIACTPDEAVGVLERAQDAMGFTQLDCTFFFGGITHDQARRSLRLFAGEVLPKLTHRAPRGV